MCYKDMTFCVNDECTRTCYRKLTKEIAEEAKKEKYACLGQYFCTDCGNERQ